MRLTSWLAQFPQSIARRINLLNQRHPRSRQRSEQRSVMRCSSAERLEQRTLLTIFYVDDSFAITDDVGIVGVLDAGDTVTFAPGEPGETTGLIFGDNAFDTIQAAINAASTSGDTIQVASGEYKENPIVDKSVSINGPNVGTAGDGTRLTEAHVVANGNVDALFKITVNNVSIRGLSLDGDDPLVTNINTASGHDLNASHAVRADVGVNGLTVQDNIIANISIGVRGEATALTASIGNLVDNNWFHDVGIFDFGYAVNMRTGFYADVTNNLMTGVVTGIQTNNFGSPTGPATWTFSGNEIHSYAIGIWHNLQYNGATSVTIDDNQLFAEAGAFPNNMGILLAKTQDAVGVTITNTTITGTDYGIALWNSSTAATITLGATNSIVDAKTGVYLTNNLTFNPAGTTTFGVAVQAGNLLLDGVSITGSDVAVEVEGQTGIPGATATIQGATTLSGSSSLTDVGVRVSGPAAATIIQDATVAIHGFEHGVDVDSGSASISGVQIYNNSTGIRFRGTGTGSVTAVDFDDVNDNDADLRIEADAGIVTIGGNNTFAADNVFIDNRSNQDYDLTSYTAANWGGLTSNFRIEDHLFHAPDDTSAGLITWVAGNLYVSAPGTGFSEETIQAAITAASTGNTVNVEAGTYHEDVTISKQVNLLGAGIDQSIISGPVGGSTATIGVGGSSNGSLIDGFTVTRDGNTVATWNDNLNLTGLSIQANGGIEVRNSKFTGNRTGIDINTGNNNYIHNNIVDNNRTGIILRNDCLDNLITQNDITNNWTQGVVWLGGIVDGDGAGTVISGNNISGNWYSQIEDRDGTSGTFKNFSGNWLGTSTPTTDPTDEAAAPGYSSQIPVIFGGTATAPDPASIPTIRGTGLAFLDFSPYLVSGIDTSPDIGFQGDFSHLIVTTVGGQSGSSGRIQEAADLLADGSLTGTARTIEVLGGTYGETSNLNKALTLNLNNNITVSSLDSVALATIQLQTFTLTVGDNSTSHTLAGGVSGAGGLIKQGADTLILAGTNSFTGTTTINAGTLLVNGTTSSNTIVNTGAVLGGNGTVAGTVTVASGGTLAPGNSPGIINTGNLTLVAGSTFAVEVNGPTPGSEADEVIVTGTVDITGATLATSGTVASFPGQVITLIDNLGIAPVTGTFAGLAEGATVIINGTSFTLSYVGGTGNDVTLSEGEAVVTIDNVTINEAAGTLDFNLTIDKPLTIDMVVTVTFTGGTATGGNVDYISTTQQVTFLAGATSHVVSVPIINDGLVEATEDFFASLSTSTDLGGRVVNFSDTGTGTITDNDSATVSIAPIADGAETDTPTDGTFRVTLTAPSSTDTVVTYTVGGTATPGTDYTSLTGSVTIPAGDLFADITVAVLNDAAAEDTETVIVTVTGITSADAEITLDPIPANLTATVNITDDDALIITSGATASIPENTPASTVIIDVNTNDTPGHTVTYQLSGPDAALFAISATGEVTFLASPDYENPLDQGADNVYNVTVTATADFVPPKIATQDLTITVTAENDNAPVITSVITSATVAENIPNSTVLLDIDATDADVPAQALTYTLTGPDAAVFAINSATGELTFLASPDYDNPLDQGADNVYNVTVNVTDSGAPTQATTQDLTITVTPLNDNAPVITSPATSSVAENTPAATVVLDVNATDADLPAQTLTYTLSGPDAAVFAINSATGEITFLASPDYDNPLDQGADNVYNVTVNVTDNGAPTQSTSQDLAITVTPLNDSVPVITSDASASVNENTPASTVVLDVNATDADVPAQTLTYSLSGIDAALFSIDSATGEIRFLSSPDFENPLDDGVNNVYNVTVTVTDSGTSTSSTTQDLTIIVTAVNDNTPVITSPATASVAENTPISTVVLNVDASDTDIPPQTLTYSLSGPDAALFAINSTTGEITFLASPDYEAPGDVGGDNVYNVTVAVTDNGVPTNAATQDLTITVTPVNDNGPVFVDASPTFSIPENSAVGTVVGGVTATDADSPAQSLTYSIISGNESGAFTIDPATGEITVADSTPLNYEVTPQFTLVVRVTDNGSPTASTADATVVIDLTNVQEGAVLTIPNPQGTYHIGSVPAFISPDATFTYDDVSNPNYAGAQVTVSIVAGRGKRDKLSVFRKGDGNNEIDVKGRRIYFNGELIGKSKGGKGAAHPDLVITLTGSATTAAVDNLVRRLNFEAKGDVGTTRTINVQVTNISGVDSNVATRDIDVVN